MSRQTSTGAAIGGVGRSLLVGALAVSVISTLWLATQRQRGDFYATLPGGYAQTLNPVLWNSPDLRDSWAFQKSTYLHGPVQFLTLYPIVFLDSYRQIAWALLPVYAFTLWAAFRVMLSVVTGLTDRHGLALPVAVSLALFVPAMQAFVHREFEVVVLLALTAALWCLVRDRRGAAGAIVAYIAWFKYIPLLFLGYFTLRGWVRAVATCLGASAVILGAAHLLFGLQFFFNNNVPEHASHAFNLSQAAFCAGWSPNDETLSSIRQGLCRVQDQLGIPMARNGYIALCGLVAVAFLTTFGTLRRQRPEGATEMWRRAFEFSIMTTISAAFFFGHYYYLSALWIPFTVLFARYSVQDDRRRWGLWALAYVLVSLSAVPLALASWALHADTWSLYMRVPVYLYGDLLLVGLLLWEYRLLASPPLSSSVGALAGT